jgi:hypothetical protein
MTDWSLKYPPESPKLARIGSGEEHICSFQLGQMKKSWPFGYRPGMVIFNCHVTTERLIFEFVALPKWLSPMIKATLFFVDAPPSAEFTAKAQLFEADEAKKEFTGKVFSIGYGHIAKFEKVKDIGFSVAKIVLNDPPADVGEDGLVFNVGMIQHGIDIEQFGRKKASERVEDFVSLGNSMLLGLITENRSAHNHALRSKGDIFSDNWMKAFGQAWNSEPEVGGMLSAINFSSVIGYGFHGERRPRGVLVVDNGYVTHAGSYSGETLQWDIRASTANWNKWISNGITL